MADVEMERLDNGIHDEESYQVAVAITRRSGQDYVIDATKPPVYRLGMALLSIFGYVGACVIDVLLLSYYCSGSDWLWLGITFMIIIIPNIIIQLLSCKWYHDDDGVLRPLALCFARVLLRAS